MALSGNVLDDEVRIVLLGKTGSGKSATGNTILNETIFVASGLGSSETSKCAMGRAQIFGKNLEVIDTPGVFDTNTPEDVVTKEIAKCVGMASPGPHCFLLVIELKRFTNEDENSINMFFKMFGEDVSRFSIVLFTKKDDLDFHQITLDSYISMAPEGLRKIIKKCQNRYIAFNNRAEDSTRNDQVRDLLVKVDKVLADNLGKYFTNDMILAAEQIMKDREQAIESERQQQLEKEKLNIQRGTPEDYNKELELLHQKYKNLPHPRREARSEAQNETGDIIIFLIRIILRTINIAMDVLLLVADL